MAATGGRIGYACIDVANGYHENFVTSSPASARPGLNW
jgi:hypothetical protein